MKSVTVFLTATFALVLVLSFFAGLRALADRLEADDEFSRIALGTPYGQARPTLQAELIECLRAVPRATVAAADQMCREGDDGFCEIRIRPGQLSLLLAAADSKCFMRYGSFAVEKVGIPVVP